MKQTLIQFNLQRDGTGNVLSNIKDVLQKVYQEGKSTKHALLDLYTNVIQSIEKQEKSSGIFLDFAQAFDTVDQKILLIKLDYYVIRGIALR